MSTRSQLRAMVFDMDGTLIESHEAVPDAYIATVQKLGGPSYTRDDIVQAYGVGPPSALLTHLLGRATTARDVDSYYERLDAHARTLAAYPGIEDALEALARVIPLAVYTGASTRSCTMLLERAGLARYFRLLLGADEVPNPKPSPDGVVLACERLGVSPEAAAYVGDAPRDLEAARRARTLAVAAAWGHQYAPGTPADLVARTPSDLLGLINAERAAGLTYPSKQDGRSSAR